MTTYERSIETTRVKNLQMFDNKTSEDLYDASFRLKLGNIGNGDVNNNELSSVKGVRSNIQAQIDGISGQISAGPAGTRTYDGTCVIISSATMVTRYCPTYIETLMNGVTVSKITATGTYNSSTGVMTYENGIVVNGDGGVSGTDKLAAYLNANNVFQDGFSNIFIGDVVIAGRFSEQYTISELDEPANNFTFNQILGNRQKIVVDGTGTCTINFSNLVPAVISLCIVPTDGFTLEIGTISSSGTITNKFKEENLEFPAVLESGKVYIYVIDIHEQAIHIAGRIVTIPM